MSNSGIEDLVHFEFELVVDDNARRLNAIGDMIGMARLEEGDVEDVVNLIQEGSRSRNTFDEFLSSSLHPFPFYSCNSMSPFRTFPSLFATH